MTDQLSYLTLKSQAKSGTSWFDNIQEIVGGEYRFSSVDEALQVLGSEGWECIMCHRDDGPRQQIVVQSLIQPPPWPVQYELVFKRRAA